jgi:hypothetical protein
MPKYMWAQKQGTIVDAVFKTYGEYLPFRTRWELRGGVCMGASAFYLINRIADNGDYWSWLADMNHKWEVISQYLDVGYNMLPPPEAQRRIQDDVLNVRLKHVGTKVIGEGEQTAYNASSLASALLAGSEGFGIGRLCFLSKTDGPAHAIALIRYNSPRLMDPNFGEMKFRSRGSLGQWMENVWNRHYARYDRAHINYYSQR